MSQLPTVAMTSRLWSALRCTAGSTTDKEAETRQRQAKRSEVPRNVALSGEKSSSTAQIKTTIESSSIHRRFDCIDCYSRQTQSRKDVCPNGKLKGGGREKSCSSRNGHLKQATGFIDQQQLPPYHHQKYKSNNKKVLKHVIHNVGDAVVAANVRVADVGAVHVERF